MLDVVRLEWVTVDPASALELRAEADGGGELDHRRLVSDLLGLLDGGLNALKVVVSVLDPLCVPTVSLESLQNILSEGTLGVAVYTFLLVQVSYRIASDFFQLTNRNVVVVVDHDQVTELQVAGSRGSLAGNTLHSASITEESVGVVVDKIETWLVEDGSSVGLSNSHTDGVGETLTKRTSGDLNTGGVVSFGVTGSLAVELLQESVRLFVVLWWMGNIHGSSSGHP